MPGTYTFRPIKANITHDTDWLGKMDPYCSFRVGAERIKGPICKNGGKNPQWENAVINVPSYNEPSLVVDLLDKDKILHDDDIGSFVIDLNEIQSVGQISKWYPIYYRKKPAGEILVEAAFQPVLVQQVIVQEPIVVEKIVEKPVVVGEVVRETVVQAPVTTHTHQEFHSGPVIQGISHIHHEGQGHGLVPNHGPILNQGVTQQSNYTQGFVQGGNVVHQGHLGQGHLDQGHLGQGHLGQGHLGQGHLDQGHLGQGHLGQGNLVQGNLGQGNLGQGNLGQGNLVQGNLGQGNLGQGNLGHHHQQL